MFLGFEKKVVWIYLASLDLLQSFDYVEVHLVNLKYIFFSYICKIYYNICINIRHSILFYTYFFLYLVDNEKPDDTRMNEIRVKGASTALLSMLRSWTGILLLNSPGLMTRPIQTLVEVLTIQTHQSRKVAYETRRLILDIIYKSLNLQVLSYLHF